MVYNNSTFRAWVHLVCLSTYKGRSEIDINFIQKKKPIIIMVIGDKDIENDVDIEYYCINNTTNIVAIQIMK